MSAELRVRSERCREETSHRDALGRVEGWLLHSGIQIEYGEQQGGIAGWLDENGQPDFVYLEIAGYYMTAMAWLASGGAMNADTARSLACALSGRPVGSRARCPAAGACPLACTCRVSGPTGGMTVCSPSISPWPRAESPPPGTCPDGRNIEKP